jgi:hypothetical protein
MTIELPHTNFFIDDAGLVYYDKGIVVQNGQGLHEVYLLWVADGNTAEEWQPDAVEPETTQSDMEEEI